MSLPMLQVALDNQTMDSAYETTRQIAEEVDIIEVGTILCVGEGVRAVRDLKRFTRTKSYWQTPKLPMRAKSFLVCALKPTLTG